MALNVTTPTDVTTAPELLVPRLAVDDWEIERTPPALLLRVIGPVVGAPPRAPKLLWASRLISPAHTIASIGTAFTSILF